MEIEDLERLVFTEERMVPWIHGDYLRYHDVIDLLKELEERVNKETT